MITDCDYSFGMISGDINQNHIQSSSSYGLLNNVDTARISLLDQHGTGWIPAIDDHQPWLEVTLESVHSIVALTTQGCGNEDFWVTSYSISYSRRSMQLIGYLTLDQQKVFHLQLL